MTTTTRSLSPVRRHGSFRIATLDEREVTAWAIRDRVAVHGTRRPLAVLIATSAGLIARDMEGRPLPPAAIDALCPGALSEFRAATGSANQSPEEEEETDP
jgi:hypothetical protein